MIANRLPIAVEYAAIVASIIVAAVASSIYFSDLYYDIAIESKKSDVRGRVNDATRIITYFQHIEQGGSLTREQAQEGAVQIIKAVHHDQDDYLWINTYDGTMILHPNAGLIGKQLYDLTDSRGNYLFHKFREMAQGEGFGFVRYFWPKPSFADPVEKISYINGFVQWQWIIGAGLYMDDINDARSTYLNRSLVVMLTVGFVLISIITFRFMSLWKEVRSIRATLGDLSKGKFSVQINDDIHRNNPFYGIWQDVASVGKYLGSLERKHLDHQTSKERARCDFETRIRTLLTDCERNVVASWEDVRGSLTGIRNASGALGGQIDETHKRADDLMARLDGETRHISDARSYLEKCRDVMAGCSANFEEVIMRHDKLTEIARSTLGYASKFNKAADDDLQQSISLLKSVAGHIRLVDMILTEHVIVDSNDNNQNNYFSISAETKCILQHMDETIELLTARRATYILDLPELSHLQITGISVLGPWQREAPLANMKDTEQAICTLADEMTAAIETVNGFGTFSRDTAQSTAKQNAELIKVVWRLSDVAASMDEIIRHIETTLGSVREHMGKPV